ncbi:hypothetical protein AGLY_018114 [Aphis glycines]|uniref:Uncharacterized protein n=1 Tax=Aphis glycines TaxID=307491 RepID=A0A6G0STU3_APHGL|nr:hypothetical protein AGLY_018114 [Aphis glycines]
MNNKIKDPNSRSLYKELTDISESYNLMPTNFVLILESRNLLMIILLNSILVPTSKSYIIDEVSNKRKIIKTSIADERNSLCLLVSTLNDLYCQVNTLIENCYKIKQKLQPCICIIGTSYVSVTEFYVYYFGTYYKFANIVKSIDVCLKIFLVFNLKYPVQSELVWTFLEKYFFNKDSHEIGINQPIESCLPNNFNNSLSNSTNNIDHFTLASSPSNDNNSHFVNLQSLVQSSLKFSLFYYAKPNFSRKDAVDFQLNISQIITSCIANEIEKLILNSNDNKINESLKVIYDFCKDPFKEIYSEYKMLNYLKSINVYRKPSIITLGNQVQNIVLNNINTIDNHEIKGIIFPLEFQLKKYFELPVIPVQLKLNIQIILMLLFLIQESFFQLGLIVGDNLGLNHTLGFSKSFSATHFCRFCQNDKKETQILPNKIIES